MLKVIYYKKNKIQKIGKNRLKKIIKMKEANHFIINNKKIKKIINNYWNK